MNLLLIAEDTSKQLHKNYACLESELAKLVNLTVWKTSGHISYILKQIPTKPDFILLLHDMNQHLTPMIKGLAHIDIPVGLFVNDVHRFVKLRKNYIEKNNIPYIFSVVRDYFLKTYPEFKNKLEWFPHFIHPELYKDYRLKKDTDLLMMGASDDVYPLRQRILKAYANDNRFVYHKHPGYRNFSKEEENHSFIGLNYAQELNKAKIFFTCPSLYNYPVLKYYEALACKALLLAPTFPELEDLGFMPDYHFVPIDKDNFKAKAAYFLENDTERQKIVEQGYHFIHQKHTVTIRAQQLVQKLSHIIQN